MKLSIGGPEQIITAAFDLWTKIRETTDPEIRRRFDWLIWNDYLYLREKLGIPEPPPFPEAKQEPEP